MFNRSLLKNQAHKNQRKMRTLKFLSVALILLAGMILTFHGCQKDETIVVNPNELFKQTEYNLNLKEFAIALSKAVNDHDNLRKVIKEESLLMFDGDYDILMKQFKTKSVTDSKSKKSVVVKDLLLSYYPQEKRNKGANDIIDELTALYPDLQISVPVHAEDWDENYIPKVTFLSEEYNEQTQNIPGYQNGEVSALDAINVPDKPVIVIGLNERLIDPDGPPSLNEAPNVSITLSGITTESGIRLTWTNSQNSGGFIFWYYIYRKYAGQSNFQLYSINNGQSNRTFDDIYASNNVSYSYYVTAVNEFGESDPSNIVNITAPNNPNTVLNFDATQMAKDNLELRWDSDYSEYFEGTKVFKRTINIDNDYYLFGTYNTNTHYAIDNNLAEGERVNYKIHQYSSLGLSNPKYDFIQVPHRDISYPTKVFVEKVKFTDWDVEHWPAGKPEFRLTVAGVNPTANQSYAIQDYMELSYCNSHSYNSFNDKNILNWQPSIWHEMISLNLVEHDASWGHLSVNLSAKYKTKKPDKSNFQADAGINYSFEIKDGSENCGNAYYTYYDNTYTWIYFPNYGARILVSDVDYEESCSTSEGF
jgi:hypothetical protein